jgi:hypothetical protein
MTQTNGQNNIYSIFRDKLSLVKQARITKGSNKMGYDLENEPENLQKY